MCIFLGPDLESGQFLFFVLSTLALYLFLEVFVSTTTAAAAVTLRFYAGPRSRFHISKFCFFLSSWVHQRFIVFVYATVRAWFCVVVCVISNRFI